MKKMLKPKLLPAAAALLGVAGLILRRTLYVVGMDDRNLLVANHPLEIALLLLSGAVLAGIFAAVRKLDGSEIYEDNFAPSFAAAVGHIAAAAGIFLTVRLNWAPMPGNLGALWTVLGYLAPVCLVLAGWERLRGKRPFFLLHILPCLFLVFHIVNHYQTWSGDPQLQDYVFALFGAMALTLFSFYCAAFDAGCGNRRMQLGMGLAAGFLCIVELANTGYGFLYLGGAVWALTGLCALNPRPKLDESGEDA